MEGEKSDVGGGLREAVSLLRRSWWVVLLLGLCCAVVALGFSLLQTPLYLASSTLYVTSGSDANAQSAYQGSLASQQRVASYVKLVTSDEVLDGAIRETGAPRSAADLRENVVASTAPNTVLMTIAVSDPDPSLAVALVRAVGDSLVSYVRQLETPDSGGDPLAKLTVVSSDPAATGPVSPKILRNVVVALFGGVVAGVVFVMFTRRFTSKVRGWSDIEDVVGAPLIGTIPSDVSLRDGKQVNFSAGGSVVGEAYRMLRTNLSFLNVDGPAKLIMVTSAKEAEGKSTVVTNLSRALVEDGARVVVVDGDLRRPTAAKRMGALSGVGLSDVLRSECTVDDAIFTSGVGSADVLPAGATPPNPAELLGSARSQQLFEDLAGKYDFVIVDTTPLLPVADAAVLSRWMDGVLLVIRAEKSKASETVSAIAQLDAVHANVLGVVINDLPGRIIGGYYSSPYLEGGNAVAKGTV
ncbi:polysaccharide biosynthesis tyrosine autokinase [Gordonia sp. NPDC003376]